MKDLVRLRDSAPMIKNPERARGLKTRTTPSIRLLPVLRHSRPDHYDKRSNIFSKDGVGRNCRDAAFQMCGRLGRQQ